jgi:hypothetical protein
MIERNRGKFPGQNKSVTRELEAKSRFVELWTGSTAGYGQ